MVIQCRGSAGLEHVWWKLQITEFHSADSFLVPQLLQRSVSLEVPCGSVIFHFLPRIFAIPFEIVLCSHPKMMIFYVCSSVVAEHSLVSFVFLISPI